jgi:hypothetical protein
LREHCRFGGESVAHANPPAGLRKNFFGSDLRWVVSRRGSMRIRGGGRFTKVGEFRRAIASGNIRDNSVERSRAPNAH